jgi:hypothetical protein
MPLRGQMEPEQQVQSPVNDGEASSEQYGSDKGKQRAKPEPVIEQPERGIGLAAAEMTCKTDEQEKNAE